MGGYAALAFEKDNKKLLWFHQRYKHSTKIQEMELLAIRDSIEWMLRTKQEKVTIVSDCLNAVHYILKQAVVPQQYRELTQEIRELRCRAIEEGRILNIIWIPGHARNFYNEAADLFAKFAAQGRQIRPDWDEEAIINMNQRKEWELQNKQHEIMNKIREIKNGGINRLEKLGWHMADQGLV